MSLTVPRAYIPHLVFLGCGIAAYACFARLYLLAQIESLFTSYKEWAWVSGSSFAPLYRARMRVVLLSALGFCASVLGHKASVVDQYVANEGPIAKAELLANIGSGGSRSSGAKPGVVIASPSTEDPNYLYTWIRDASLVYKCLIDQYTLGEDHTLRGHIDDFVWSQTVLQQVSNPSGILTTGGLGEPKFKISLEAFTGGWGRPQKDGPALRSIALITYANWLLEQKNVTYVTQKIWPVVKLDLDYVTNRWNSSGFDLWEEVSSASFFTSAVQHKALRQGVTFAKKIGQASAVTNWATQAENILCFLQVSAQILCIYTPLTGSKTYWNSAGSHITSNTNGGRSGIDANSALASIHTFDAAAGCDATTFQPCSDKALASLKIYVDAFRTIYTINNGTTAPGAVATGRYPEDVYYNGNPWYLTTAAVAEQLYDALIVWEVQRSLTVTKISLAFFQQFLPSVKPGTYASNSKTYKTLVDAIRQNADDFLAVNAKYTPADGSLSEQYQRDTGVPLSAKHLTWSYASALTVFAARAGRVLPSWGAKGLKVPSGACVGNPGPIISATFSVVAETVFGENVYLTGSIDQLKNWSPDNALLLSADAYPTWSITLDIPASTNFEFKFIKKNNGTVSWESDPNNQATSPDTGNVTFASTWR
ncbi:hypothetical protein H0H87_006651 [Tephrocybe sp. NHM501043]|nr:hypothetical protein H0H87_006651 [Tephrocybe sp. NHM501043]